LKFFAKNAARPWGFTLVELLTVIAIIAVLATLTSVSLANAQRKGRKAVSTSNLRQIALAFNLYVDDQQMRPATFRELKDGNYLTERVLLCPEDRIFKNWAGLLEGADSGRKPEVSMPLTDGNTAGRPGPMVGDVPHSYFKSFDYFDVFWDRIDKSALGGVAACQLHGIGRQSKDTPPSLDAFQGLVLRALKDGSVISRQVLWGVAEFGSAASPSSNYGPSTVGESSQLPLFLDLTE
jgi:prepilin-type N-terminal cleavage/methylation domain-containing protein